MKTPILFGSLLFVLATLGFAGGCDGGREGERCNPNLSHDECDHGLSCQVTTACDESYCCPSPATSSKNPFCNGDPAANAGCPTPDAGAPADAGNADTASE